MTGLILSTIAYFVAVWYIRRYLDSFDAPPGFTRWALTATLAAFVSYAVWALLEALGL